MAEGVEYQFVQTPAHRHFAKADRPRVQVPRSPQDRRPRPHSIRERLAERATARIGFGEAAPQRRCCYALPPLFDESRKAGIAHSRIFTTVGEVFSAATKLMSMRPSDRFGSIAAIER